MQNLCTRIKTRQVSFRGDSQVLVLNVFQAIDAPTRIAISRVTNLIKVLASHFVPLSDVILLEAYEWAVENDVEVKELTQPDICEALIATVGTKR